MIREVIELRVDAETARAFGAATREERERLAALVCVWLRRPVKTAPAAGERTGSGDEPPLNENLPG